VCNVRSHEFLQEFLEVGGVLTVVEILSVKQATESDRAEALKLLTCVASAGRQYKELVCEGHGQRSVRCMPRVFMAFAQRNETENKTISKQF